MGKKELSANQHREQGNSSSNALPLEDSSAGQNLNQSNQQIQSESTQITLAQLQNSLNTTQQHNDQLDDDLDKKQSSQLRNRANMTPLQVKTATTTNKKDLAGKATPQATLSDNQQSGFKSNFTLDNEMNLRQIDTSNQYSAEKNPGQVERESQVFVNRNQDQNNRENQFQELNGVDLRAQNVEFKNKKNMKAEKKISKKEKKMNKKRQDLQVQTQNGAGVKQQKGKKVDGAVVSGVQDQNGVNEVKQNKVGTKVSQDARVEGQAQITAYNYSEITKPDKQLEENETAKIISEDLVKPFSGDPINKADCIVDKTIAQLVDDDMSAEGLKVQQVPMENEEDASPEMIRFCEQVDLLQKHREGYQNYLKRQQQDQLNKRWSHDNLKKKLQEKPIKCVKYNYTLQPEVMNHMQFESTIQISKDGEEFIIMNHKPNTMPQYIYQQTPDELREEEEAKKYGRLHGEVYDQYREINKQYSWAKSSASCKIKDIKGFVTNGTSSRFWIYRKHISSIDYTQMTKDNQEVTDCAYPFFAWQCLTLELQGRTVDLVIKDNEQMYLLVRFLVQALNTYDGRRDTAQFYIDATVFNEIERREKKINKKVLKNRENIELPDDEEFCGDCTWIDLSDQEKQQIRDTTTEEIYRQTNFKFLMMRIRSKISFQAFKKRQIINEHFLRKILNAYQMLVNSGSITAIAPYTYKMYREYDHMLDNYFQNPIIDLKRFAQNPVIIQRRADIRLVKEVKRMGYESIDDMNPEQQEEARKISYFRPAYNPRDVANDCNMCPEKTEEYYENFWRKMSIGINTKCPDMFYETKVDDMNMYDQRSSRVMVHYKHNKNVLDAKLLKVKFMLGVGNITDVFYIKTLLKKKQLVKQMFVQNVEHSTEVFIPLELSCDQYPYSFRYYDPIIQITNQLFSGKQKQFHCLRTEFFLQKNQKNDHLKTFLEAMGALETPGGKAKQLQKHQVIKEKQSHEIRHNQSKHASALQKSRYLMVDSTEQGLIELAKLVTYDLEKVEVNPLKKTIKPEDQQLEIRFCQDKEVADKKQKFLKFKQVQFMKHQMLKQQGQKFNTTQKLHAFIEDNIEQLYAMRPRHVNYNTEILDEFKNLDQKQYKKLSTRQKGKLQADKDCYQEYLLEQAELKIIARRAHEHKNVLDLVYKECAPSVSYQQRERYIEKELEKKLQYFRSMNENQVQESAMDKIQAELRKMEKEITAARTEKKRLEDEEERNTRLTRRTRE